MRLIINIVSAFLLIVTFSTSVRAQAFGHIKNYQVYYAWAHSAPQDRIVLRRFVDNSRVWYLMVDPQTMETMVTDSGIYHITPMGMAALMQMFKSRPYPKARAKAQKQSVVIQDAGIERGLPKEAGISLTADLCPSHKPLDRLIFTQLFAAFGRVERPVPVALSVTGLWMNRHQQDLSWLKQLEEKREISITWINHSYNHRVSTKLPLKQNFLLEPGTNINYEILQTEQDMLANGLLPSVFFRFPGLVSDQQLVNKITAFGLIPVGSDAWLAKGQQPQAGSIVLIHGNGNEPIGVQDLIKLLQTKSSSIANKQWLLYDLRESVDEEFK